MCFLNIVRKYPEELNSNILLISSIEKSVALRRSFALSHITFWR